MTECDWRCQTTSRILIAGNAVWVSAPWKKPHQKFTPFIHYPRRFKALTSQYKNWASVELYWASRRKSSYANGSKERKKANIKEGEINPGIKAWRRDDESTFVNEEVSTVIWVRLLHHKLNSWPSSWIVCQVLDSLRLLPSTVYRFILMMTTLILVRLIRRVYIPNLKVGDNLIYRRSLKVDFSIISCISASLWFGTEPSAVCRGQCEI